MTYSIHLPRSRSTMPLPEVAAHREQTENADLYSPVSVDPSQSSLIVTRTSPPSAKQFAVLKSLLRQHGLFEKQPRYYTFKITLTFSLLALGIILFLALHIFWIQLLIAVFLAFVSAQLGLLGHDAGHRQIFRKTWKNDVVGLISGNLCLGLSHQWWLDKHNRHHSHPNQNDMDPDINIPVLAFTSEDLQRKGKIIRFILKHQAYFFFPVLLLVTIDMQRTGVKFLWRTKCKYRITEVALILAHHVCYFGIIFAWLGIWQAILFMLLHQGLTGLYLGSIFAPNHKGMPVLEKDTPMDFLHRQVITARNVRANPFTDFWYGGLNYQIEHHLFPAMARNKLRAAQPIIKAYCQDQAIPYYETGVFRSYGEILQYLHHISLPLRLAARKT